LVGLCHPTRGWGAIIYKMILRLLGSGPQRSGLCFASIGICCDVCALRGDKTPPLKLVPFVSPSHLKSRFRFIRHLASEIQQSVDIFKIHSEGHRRFAEVIDLGQRRELVAVTRDLTLSGCFVKTTTPFPRFAWESILREQNSQR
jgi:hypothetical protein